MSQTLKDQNAANAVRSVITRLLDPSAVADIRVDAAPDQSDEPALFVSIDLKSSESRPSAHQRIDLQIALRSALEEIDDDRFPYLSFSAPEDSRAEDTRKIA